MTNGDFPSNFATTLIPHSSRFRSIRQSAAPLAVLVAASPITDIRRIARVMLDRDVDGVPIVNETGALVGFVSRSDILRAVVTDPPLSIWR